MKKVFMALVACATAMTMSAQLFVAGNLELGVNSNKEGKADAVTTTTFGINPEIGYKLNEKAQVALELGFNTSKVKDCDAVNQFKVGVNGRYTFAQVSSLNFFGELGVGYFSTKSGDADACGSIYVQVRPGVSYDFNEKFSLAAKFNLFSFVQGLEKKKNNVVVYPKTTDIFFGLPFENVSLGVQYNF